MSWKKKQRKRLKNGWDDLGAVELIKKMQKIEQLGKENWDHKLRPLPLCNNTKKKKVRGAFNITDWRFKFMFKRLLIDE